MRSVLIGVLAGLLGCGPSVRGGDDNPPGNRDGDSDGYTPDQGDCDDANAAINPGVSETCTDGVDNNCDGNLDSADYACKTPCERAFVDRSSIGCVYYGVDTNALGGPYAIAISNIDAAATANVVIEAKENGTWAPISGGMLTVGPRSLQTVTPPRRTATGSQLMAGGAYRVTSDLPVIAYQFAPIDGAASFLSDASLLLPTSSLDTYYIVPAWPRGRDIGGSDRPAHLQIAAAGNATVTITSPIASLAGSVPTLTPNVPQSYNLTEGDVLQLDVGVLDQSFAGTYIESSGPIAVFTSNDCANVPFDPNACCCEHLEEQIFGLQTWGTSYVAAQMPRRANEGAVWQILAQQDGTNVTFTPAAGVTGLPPSVTLGARQLVTYEVTGGTGAADFLVTSDKPVLVTQYTVGAFHAGSGDVGDPDMVQAIPSEQFLPRYVVLVPGTWVNDFLVLTRKAGVPITVDGATPNVAWRSVPGGWETGTLDIPDGVHVLESATPFGVAVSGYDMYDSYSYPGGLSQTVINPIL
ncbi:MAG: MopE-related protein [Kofleriaceae bacterium]|nr:MopE-related protein [Kofleriaceae bacterium]